MHRGSAEGEDESGNNDGSRQREGHRGLSPITDERVLNDGEFLMSGSGRSRVVGRPVVQGRAESGDRRVAPDEGFGLAH